MSGAPSGSLLRTTTFSLPEWAREVRAGFRKDSIWQSITVKLAGEGPYRVIDGRF